MSVFHFEETWDRARARRQRSLSHEAKMEVKAKRTHEAGFKDLRHLQVLEDLEPQLFRKRADDVEAREAVALEGGDHL